MHCGIPETQVGGYHYLSSRCRGYLGVTTRLYPASCCGNTGCHHLYLALYEKEFLHSNRNTNRIPLNQLRRVSQPHLVLRCYPSLPTPGAVGIPGQAQQYMCEDLTTISGRPHYPTLRFRNIWASLTHLALFEYPGSSRCTLQSLRT